MLKKTHKSAVCVVPPDEIQDPIQDIRAIHDRQFERWMPHINLLYPFLPDREFIDQLPILARVMHQVEPFEVTLSRFDFFSHASGSATVWLRPEPGEKLITLQRALANAYPDCREQARFAHGFTPHLSVGQTGSPRAARQLIEKLQIHWNPLRFVADQIVLIQRGTATPFRIANLVPLRGRKS